MARIQSVCTFINFSKKKRRKVFGGFRFLICGNILCLAVGKEPLAGEIVGNGKIAKCFNFNVLKKEKAVRFGGTAFSCAGGEGS